MIQINIRHRNYLIAALIGIFALIALWIRLIPMFNMGQTDILNMVAMDDPLYNLRQVEVMLAQFPGYSWFDPMTLYPVGSTIYWGPLFPAIIAICCLVTGASTRPEIISIALLVPPLLAAATVVVMYYVGRVFGDWKTGVLASGFTAVICGQFFTVSFYGYIDHHIAEVLFSTVFCLLYSYTIVSEKDRPIDLKDIRSYKNTIILSICVGITYLIGLFTMPTMILFAMIVAIFTLIQFIIDFYRGRSSEYLLVLNGVTFGCAILGLLLFGLKNPGIDLSTYSIGHVYAYLGLIGGTALLWYTARALRGKEKYLYPGLLAGIAIAFVAVLYLFSQPLYSLFVSSLFAFFGQQAITNTVQEAMGWSFEHAWLSFNYGLLLFAGGALVILYNNVRDEHPHHIFALVWSLVMLLSTWQHIRYEYYLAINIALLSAICAGFAGDRTWRSIKAAGIARNAGPSGGSEREKGDSPKKKTARSGKKKADQPRDPDYLPIALAILVAALACMFVYTSVSLSYTVVSGKGGQMNPDWKESLEWLGNNTPETGVDYLTIYDPKSFRYPDQSYGVMSWWDYGHMITYIAKRIPNANPFQQGVTGPNGSASYFVATSEETANRILDSEGTRYVVTDIPMDDLVTGKFHAMATWHNSTDGLTPYIKTFSVQSEDNASQFRNAYFIDQNYFLTMVSRLHTFDGSMTNATQVYLVMYADPSVTGATLPVITGGGPLNASDAELRAGKYAEVAPAGYHAGIYSSSIVSPAGTVPALRHYRLIHESPTNGFNSDTIDVKYVKVFEYVRGAHISGSGIISIPLVTGTGRHFTYRQESINGEFIVPYSTTGNPYDVKAEGKYIIEGTGQMFDVPESAVMDGTAVN
jgi:dolichyl-phosphooligosaccharide-protein glycotransferase